MAQDRGVHGALDPPRCHLRGERRQVLIDRLRHGRGERDGLLGDPAGLPRRQPTGHHLCPAQRQPVTQLDRLTDVGTSGALVDAQRGRELGHGELLDHERTLTGQPQLTLEPEHRRLRRPRAPGVAVEPLGDLRIHRPDVPDPVQVRPVRHRPQLPRRRRVGGPPLGDRERQRGRSVAAQHLHRPPERLTGRHAQTGCGMVAWLVHTFECRARLRHNAAGDAPSLGKTSGDEDLRVDDAARDRVVPVLPRCQSG